jgi:hypothetical protein
LSPLTQSSPSCLGRFTNAPSTSAAIRTRTPPSARCPSRTPIPATASRCTRW